MIGKTRSRGDNKKMIGNTRSRGDNKKSDFTVLRGCAAARMAAQPKKPIQFIA